MGQFFYDFSVCKGAVDPFSHLFAVDDANVFQYLDVMAEVRLGHVKAHHQFAYAHFFFGSQQFYYLESLFVR